MKWYRCPTMASSLASKTTLRKEITYREMCLDHKRTIRNRFVCTGYVYKLFNNAGEGEGGTYLLDIHLKRRSC